MRIRYCWTERRGSDDYAARELVVEGRDETDCDLRFLAETGVPLIQCWMQELKDEE